MNIKKIWHSKHTGNVFVISMRESKDIHFDHLPVINMFELPSLDNKDEMDFHTELVLSKPDIMKLHEVLTKIIENE